MVPANTTATVSVPAGQGAGVRVNGALAGKAAGVISGTAAGPAAVYEVGSGEYVFTAPARLAGGF